MKRRIGVSACRRVGVSARRRVLYVSVAKFPTCSLYH